MNENRELIENRIFQIMSYIKQEALITSLRENINMFSLKDLLYIQEYLESGNLEYIYKFLEEKYKEYLGIMEEIKNLKIKKSFNNKKIEEEEERINEEYNLEMLIKL